VLVVESAEYTVTFCTPAVVLIVLPPLILTRGVVLTTMSVSGVQPDAVAMIDAVPVASAFTFQ
jgi:hypothetical protein